MEVVTCVTSLRVFMRQFRYAFDTELLEMPAGKMDHGPEDAEECGIRELKEETGCTCLLYTSTNDDVVLIRKKNLKELRQIYFDYRKQIHNRY